MKTVYLAGPMRGWIGENSEAFKVTADALRLRGFTVFSPPEQSLIPGREHWTREDWLRLDVDFIINHADALVMLPFWDESPGASLEVALAWSVGIPVLSWPDLTPVPQTCAYIPRESNKPRLIGLSGYARSGKDTIAKILVGSGGWQRVAFADVMREMLEKLDPYCSVSNRVSDLLKKHQNWDSAKENVTELRGLLQRLGTEAGRDLLDPGIWIRKVEELIESTPSGMSVVVTDVRFPNEARMIWRRGGMMVRVVRPEVFAVNDHASDNSLSEHDADEIIANDGTVSDLRDKIKALGWITGNISPAHV